jgi:peptidoglycan hydrolase-like amidase
MNPLPLLKSSKDMYPRSKPLAKSYQEQSRTDFIKQLVKKSEPSSGSSEQSKKRVNPRSKIVDRYELDVMLSMNELS